MRARRRTIAGGLAGALLAGAVAVAACGGGPRPLRVGVVGDCQGVYKPFPSAQLAGAGLPLVQRGGRVDRAGPVGGVSAARIGGRRVRLVSACTEVLEFSTLTAEIRRLVEREHVDVVVAGSS